MTGSKLWVVTIVCIAIIILCQSCTTRHYPPAPKYVGYSLEEMK